MTTVRERVTTELAALTMLATLLALVASFTVVSASPAYAAPGMFTDPDRGSTYDVTTIGVSAFLHDSLSTVVISDSVASIGEAVFFWNGLKSVTISSSVPAIDAWAFSRNNLTSVAIPRSVTSVGMEAFAENAQLSEVVFEGDAPTVVAAGSAGSFDLAADKIRYFYPGADGFSTSVWEGYAIEVVTHTVTFANDDGTVNPVAVEYGCTAAAPTDQTREGYTFTGWYLDAELTTEFDFTSAVAGDLTLYVGWEAIPAPAETDPAPSTPSTAPVSEPETTVPVTDAAPAELAATDSTPNLPVLLAAVMAVAMGAGLLTVRRFRNLAH